jgi:hypothetical protein
VPRDDFAHIEARWKRTGLFRQRRARASYGGLWLLGLAALFAAALLTAYQYPSLLLGGFSALAQLVP